MSVYRAGLPGGVAVALGWTPHEYISKFGYNADVDATAAPEDIWAGGGLYTGLPTGSAETVQVFSSSAADTAAGAGLRTILVTGLDANYSPQTELFTLNGQTPVTGTKLWTRVNRCPGQTGGSGAANAGIITVRHSSTTTNVFAQIPAGNGQTQVGAYTIPAGMRGAFTGYRASASNNTAPGTAARVQIGVYTRVFGSSLWRRNRSLWVAAGQALSHVELAGALVLAEKTDIVLRAEAGASADNLAVTASMDIFLVKA